MNIGLKLNSTWSPLRPMTYISGVSDHEYTLGCLLCILQRPTEAIRGMIKPFKPSDSLRGEMPPRMPQHAFQFAMSSMPLFRHLRPPPPAQLRRPRADAHRLLTLSQGRTLTRSITSHEMPSFSSAICATSRSTCTCVPQPISVTSEPEKRIHFICGLSRDKMKCAVRFVFSRFYIGVTALLPYALLPWHTRRTSRKQFT